MKAIHFTSWSLSFRTLGQMDFYTYASKLQSCLELTSIQFIQIGIALLILGFAIGFLGMLIGRKTKGNKRIVITTVPRTLGFVVSIAGVIMIAIGGRSPDGISVC